MDALGVPPGWVFVNQVLPEAACVHPLFRQRYAMQQGYLDGLSGQFPGAVQMPVPLLATDVVGLVAVEELLAAMPPGVAMGAH